MGEGFRFRVGESLIEIGARRHQQRFAYRDGVPEYLTLWSSPDLRLPGFIKLKRRTRITLLDGQIILRGQAREWYIRVGMRNHKALKTIVRSLPIAFLLGCGSLPHRPPLPDARKQPALNRQLFSQHVIELNAEGFLFDLRTNNRHVIKNALELTNYLNETIFTDFATNDPKKTNIMLFVHGGLNDRKAGRAHFSDDYADFQNTPYYPVFVVWPSGFGATYLEHLLWVRQGLKAETGGEKTFSIATTPFMLLADLGRAVMRLPMVVANNSRSDVETLTPIRRQTRGAAVEQYKDLRYATNAYPLAIGDDYSRTSDRLMRGVTYWATLPVKYVAATFLDGLGKGAWDNMLRRTEEVYPARIDTNVVEWISKTRAPTNTTPQQAIQTAPSTAGTTLVRSKRQEKRVRRYSAAGLPMFIEALRDRQAKDPSLGVTLVGHSMGTIILNRVVDDAEMNFENIVYLGAACSVADFSRSVLPYMKGHTNTQFYNLSLHPVAEAGEWYPMAADLVPRGSLLVWIDNFLSNPVTEQGRTLGRWRNLFRSGPTGEPIVHQLSDNDAAGSLRERLHFQAFSVGFGDKLRKAKYQWNDHPIARPESERYNTPLSHSDFSEMPYWDHTFWWAPTNSASQVR